MGIIRGGGYNYEQGRQAAIQAKNAQSMFPLATFSGCTPNPHVHGIGRVSGSSSSPSYNWTAFRRGMGLGLILGIVGAILGFYIGVRLSNPFSRNGNQAYVVAIAEFVGTIGFATGLLLLRRMIIGTGAFCFGWWACHLAYPHIDFVAILVGFAESRYHR